MSKGNPGKPTNPTPTTGIINACPTTVPKLEVILDHDNDYIVDQASPTTDFVRIGLWDKAYDVAGNIKNNAAEADNFVGADTRRFYFRVTDPNASGNHVTIEWKTLKADKKTDDDAPAAPQLTLVKNGTCVFVSRAVMLVTDDTDRDQPTDTGLSAPLETGVRNYGQTNHRTRRARIDGHVKATYSPATGGSVLTVEVPVFKRSPDERKRINVRVVSYENPARSDDATATYISGQFEHANRRWNQLGLQIDAAATVHRNVPAVAQDSNGQYPGLANNAEETAALNDLIPITPDNTVTAVFVSLKDNNAYATIGPRTAVKLGDRYFIFINTTLSLNDETLAHELAHVLFNRFDDMTERRYFTLNTDSPTILVSGTGISLPDVRIYRRIQNQHNADPNNDPPNDNIINWARRARSKRFPVNGGIGGPTATTGNNLIQKY